MSTTPLDTVLRNATIKAIDGVARKLSKAERSAESNGARLLRHWNDMDAAGKEQAVGIAIAAITTVVTAIAARRGRSKKPSKGAGKKLARAVAKKIA